MEAANSNAINALVPLSNDRIARDRLLYIQPDNLIEIALDVKKYVKSVFGADSLEYKQIQGLQFRSLDKA